MTPPEEEDPSEPAGKPLNGTEAAEAQLLCNALLALREAYPDMTVAQAAVLLHVAAKREPETMTDIRNATGVAASTATRAIQTLSGGARGVTRGPGPDLLQQEASKQDKRWRFVHCTAKGLKVVRRVIGTLRPRKRK